MSKNLRRCLLLTTIFFCVLALITLPKSLPVSAGHISPHWSYEGESSPENWGNLSADYALCKTGHSQSPINLNPETATKVTATPIQFNYKPTPLEVVNNGHTIQVNYEPGSYATINGQKYELKQFHFHTPSEHTINNQPSDLELHLVHKNQAEQLAVVGVLIKEGVNNPILEQIWSNIPTSEGTNPAQGTINIQQILPKDGTYYHYSGSLTTPPCSEQVNWNVLTSPIEASPEQIAQFRQIYAMNARPTQELDNRRLELTSPKIPALW